MLCLRRLDSFQLQLSESPMRESSVSGKGHMLLDHEWRFLRCNTCVELSRDDRSKRPHKSRSVQLHCRQSMSTAGFSIISKAVYVAGFKRVDLPIESVRSAPGNPCRPHHPTPKMLFSCTIWDRQQVPGIVTTCLSVNGWVETVTFRDYFTEGVPLPFSRDDGTVAVSSAVFPTLVRQPR